MDDDPPYDISVILAAQGLAEAEAGVADAVVEALDRHGRPRARISVVGVDDAEIQRLSRIHLNRDEPTDVLAFDMRDAEGPGSGAAETVSVDGEVVISVETARREASRRGHAAAAEVALYAVHGTLHLLGYNDDDEGQADRMHTLEDEILTGMGFGSVFRKSP